MIRKLFFLLALGIAFTVFLLPLIFNFYLTVINKFYSNRIPEINNNYSNASRFGIEFQLKYTEKINTLLEKNCLLINFSFYKNVCADTKDKYQTADSFLYYRYINKIIFDMPDKFFLEKPQKLVDYEEIISDLNYHKVLAVKLNLSNNGGVDITKNYSIHLSFFEKLIDKKLDYLGLYSEKYYLFVFQQEPEDSNKEIQKPKTIVVKVNGGVIISYQEINFDWNENKINWKYKLNEMDPSTNFQLSGAVVFSDNLLYGEKPSNRLIKENLKRLEEQNKTKIYLPDEEMQKTINEIIQIF